MEEIVLNQLDPHFKFEVASHPGGENLKACFACGACTGGCPVSEIDHSYDPRKIIRMILLGMKEKVLSSDILWLCSMCFTCAFHCPQDVQFVKVMGVLRDMAVKEGYAGPSFSRNIQEIDRVTQVVRRHMVMSIVQKKQEDVIVNPKDLLRRVVEQM